MYVLNDVNIKQIVCAFDKFIVIFNVRAAQLKLFQQSKKCAD